MAPGGAALYCWLDPEQRFSLHLLSAE